MRSCRLDVIMEDMKRRLACYASLPLFFSFSSLAMAHAYETVPGEFLVRKAPGAVSILSVSETLPDGTGVVKGQSAEALKKLQAKGLIEDFEPNYVYRIVGGAFRPPAPPALPPWPGPPPPVPFPPQPPRPTPPPSTPPAPPPTVPPVVPGAPNDPMLSRLYGMQKIFALDAWKKVKGGGSESVVTVVIDTGIDGAHPDLKDRIAQEGFNAITGARETKDDQGHGTHCAGTVAATGNNGIGVAGVAWNTKLISAKFLAAQGGGSTSDAIKAIEWAIEQPGVKILSNSWGGGGPSRALQAAIKKACDKGILFVAAAGNDNSDNDRVPAYPASYDLPCIIAVASTDQNDNFSSFSNWGATSVDVAAPGTAILSTYPGNRYQSLSGTSMATPHVSGLAALLWSAKPSLTVSEVKDIILSTSDKLGSGFLRALALQGKSVAHGRVNASSATDKALKQ